MRLVAGEDGSTAAESLTATEQVALDRSYRDMWKAFGLNQELTRMSAYKYINLLERDVRAAVLNKEGEGKWCVCVCVCVCVRVCVRVCVCVSHPSLCSPLPCLPTARRD